MYLHYKCYYEAQTDCGGRWGGRESNRIEDFVLADQGQTKGFLVENFEFEIQTTKEGHQSGQDCQKDHKGEVEVFLHNSLPAQKT